MTKPALTERQQRELDYQREHASVLVVGCGFGSDALRLARLGASVSAFDLSPDSLQIARDLAARESLQITFDEMPAERMRYKDSSFDYTVRFESLAKIDRILLTLFKPMARYLAGRVLISARIAKQVP